MCSHDVTVTVTHVNMHLLSATVLPAMVFPLISTDGHAGGTKEQTSISGGHPRSTMEIALKRTKKYKFPRLAFLFIRQRLNDMQHLTFSEI